MTFFEGNEEEEEEEEEEKEQEEDFVAPTEGVRLFLQLILSQFLCFAFELMSY